MKYLPILLLVFASLDISAQLNMAKKFEINENTDDYTGEKTTSTTWILLNTRTKLGQKSPDAYFKLHFDHTDSIVFLQLNTTTPVVTSVKAGEQLQIKLTNGELVTLENMEFTISETGGGSIGYVGSGMLGMKLVFLIDVETLKTLAETSIDKCRIATSDGYLEIVPGREDFRDEIKVRVGKFLAFIGK